ncbi:MAG: rRNA maturation RNase YbeY [Alphaproteobacteria bacterium]|nr:rRNA maturation RNase YbeY [Alphaproteobacteria bacterium]
MEPTLSRDRGSQVRDESTSQLRLSADVVLQSEVWQEIADVEALIKQATHIVARANGEHYSGAKSTQTVSVVLADDAQVRELNFAHRKIDKATNVLSFPFVRLEGAEFDEDQGGYLGDVVLAFETIMTEARQADRAPKDHVQHLVIHGLLHLLGYDHGTDAEAERMEQLEIELLVRLNIQNPYR